MLFETVKIIVLRFRLTEQLSFTLQRTVQFLNVEWKRESFRAVVKEAEKSTFLDRSSFSILSVLLFAPKIAVYFIL